ncbi:HECT-like Ubiquitin-conjugating enzyme (E2)-binding [Rhizoctonia solani]|uniref:HECT-like Ubiquitin-conjugating enzyme (E2)-binding n=1 Tax=Rhizoctonia solani TaxID=456999 RepID=A0A8H7IK64_9AGAM|nr:HECT-like Ubiquitin-conjugating enzyme (E2)-binding [Rhizoctonia solani]
MATLTRIQNLISSRRNSPAPSPALLDSRVPSPFPSLSDRHEQTGETIITEHPAGPVHSNNVAPPTLTVELAEQTVETESRGQQEILPSLLSVEQSCLMALNNLFAGILPDENWRPIVPSRRHSLPSLVASNSQAVSLSDSTPLFTLVSNLRLQNVGEVMIQASDKHDALLCELGQHVERCSELMGTKDARLARLLVTLLQFSSKLATLTPLSTSLSPPGGLTSSVSPNLSEDEVYTTLSQQASNIQLRLQDSKPSGPTQGSVVAREQAMLWAQVNHVLGDIQNLCHERAVPTPFLSPYHSAGYDRTLPPEYDHDDYSANPPVYETPSQPFVDFPSEKEKESLQEQSVHRGASSHRESIVASEKMKLDLDSVMMAIDRLYMVAPQLSNQRVELKTRKLEQMEFARVAGAIEKLVDSGRLDDQRATYRPTSALRKGKQRLEDKQDLDQLMSMIGQAASRTLDSQTVFVDDMQARMDRARRRDDAKRNEFVTQLAQHSSHGRLHGQDAVFSSSVKGRKHAPNSSLDVVDGLLGPQNSDVTDPNTMMTLPEFVKSHPGPLPKPPSPTLMSNVGSPRLLKKPSKIGLQGRGRSNSAPPLAWLTGKTSASRSPLAQAQPSNVAQMNVTYVAEYRESLGMIAVQLRVGGLARTSRLEAEVTSTLGQSSLILRCGTTTLPSLDLPSQVPAGKVDLFAASMGKPLGATEYLDLKLPTVAGVDGRELEHDIPAFIGNVRYDDLPSEHWVELLDAWMCHPDQQVTAELAKRAEGIWPMPASEGITYRFKKYTTRPIAANFRFPRVPFTAFVAADMVDLAQAHASYRFVIQDEETETPRILIWLFKSAIQLSYAGATGSLIPPSGTITAAKVTFVIFGPGGTANSLERYPTFKNAEVLSYPMDLCRRLAGSLKESNAAYPESRRSLDGMSLGWLQRS